MLTRLSDNLLKLKHHAGLKNRADELRKLTAPNITSHSTEACIRVVWLSYSLGHVSLTMDFSDLWKNCYKFTHASFHTV